MLLRAVMTQLIAGNGLIGIDRRPWEVASVQSNSAVVERLGADSQIWPARPSSSGHDRLHPG